MEQEGKVIPISELKEFAKKYGYDHVIVFATAGKMQYVATYGHTLEECDRAAQFGDKMKDVLGWPDSLHAIPPRVHALQTQIADLKYYLQKAGVSTPYDNRSPKAKKLKLEENIDSHVQEKTSVGITGLVEKAICKIYAESGLKEFSIVDISKTVKNDFRINVAPQKIGFICRDYLKLQISRTGKGLFVMLNDEWIAENDPFLQKKSEN
jgi:hypothetical protein